MQHPLTNKKSLIHNATPISHPGIQVADDRRMSVSHVGTARVQVVVDGQETEVDLKNIHYAPDAICNLLSLYQMVKGVKYAVFTEDGVKFCRRRTVVYSLRETNDTVFTSLTPLAPARIQPVKPWQFRRSHSLVANSLVNTGTLD